MISMDAFTEGLDLTVLGVTIVFIVLSILGVVLYGVGWMERRLVEKEKAASKETAPTEAVAEPEEEKIPPKDLAIITAAVLAYTAEKATQLRPVPFKKGATDAWRLYGIQSTIEEVEGFNYGVGKW